MIARWRDRLAGILPRGVILLSALTFASYVMGLVRDRTFARTFGAGSELDVYNAALVLPELVLDVLVIAGLSSAFVPVFSRLRHEGDSTEVFARTVLTASVLVMLRDRRHPLRPRPSDRDPGGPGVRCGRSRRSTPSCSA